MTTTKIELEEKVEELENIIDAISEELDFWFALYEQVKEATIGRGLLATVATFAFIAGVAVGMFL